MLEVDSRTDVLDTMRVSPAVEDEPIPQAEDAYDQVPYKSYPYPQSRPDRLATIATLMGMRPAPLERCRVLELGCSSGGNLIPSAELWPDSQFVGIDASARQIADGQAVLDSLELPNLRLERRNILSIGPDLGEFDYIIAHGVYSWVPPEVQDKLLSICARNLAPNGVAYVSYNTDPGWHMRGIIRDMMLYRTRAVGSPADRVRHARSLLNFLAQSVSAEDNAYGMLLRKELESLRDKEDHYLFHEHLEAVNLPVYFHEFMRRAEAKGLQYLGEADFSAMSVQNFPRQVETVLQSVAGDLIEMEQYMDFLRNRMFRQTLLCHRDTIIDRKIMPERVYKMHVASPAKPDALVDVRSDAPATFRGGHAVTTTTEPIVKAALLHLGEIWPKAVPFTDLLAIARSRLNAEPVVVDASHLTLDSQKLAEPLLRCYATTQVELSVHPAPLTTEVGERPVVSRHARRQAAESGRVTNLRHESVQLNDLQRHIVRQLDGERDRESILRELAGLVEAGELVVHEAGQPVRDRQKVMDILGAPLEAALKRIAAQALLRA